MKSKIFKSIVATLLSTAMLMSFAACGGNDSEEDKKNDYAGAEVSENSDTVIHENDESTDDIEKNTPATLEYAEQVSEKYLEYLYSGDYLRASQLEMLGQDAFVEQINIMLEEEYGTTEEAYKQLSKTNDSGTDITDTESLLSTFIHELPEEFYVEKKSSEFITKDEAYEYYIQSRDYAEKYFSEEDLKNAFDQFENYAIVEFSYEGSDESYELILGHNGDGWKVIVYIVRDASNAVSEAGFSNFSFMCITIFQLAFAAADAELG